MMCECQECKYERDAFDLWLKDFDKTFHNITDENEKLEKIKNIKFIPIKMGE